MTNPAVRKILDQARPRMDKAVAYTRADLGSLRSGRASISLVDNLSVEYYGQTQPLKGLATINTPDARTIAITPWDRGAMPVVEKAIRENQALGLTPNNDGQTIRLNIPPLTEERRHDIVKSLREKIENCHVSLRNIRHELLSEVRKLEKAKLASQDDAKAAETELNKQMEHYRTQIEQLEQTKTTEIMEV